MSSYRQIPFLTLHLQVHPTIKAASDLFFRNKPTSEANLAEFTTMTAYYPSQVGYATSQPVGIAQSAYGMPASYAPGGVAAPMMMAAPGGMGAPVMMQPGYNGHGYGYYNPYGWGNRVRRFFGFAPDAGVRYKSDRATWGFMGYSRRQRYIDGRTGGEVDRKGRPVIRG